MIAVLTVGFVFCFLALRGLFNLVALDFLSSLILAVFALLAWPVMGVMLRLTDWLRRTVVRGAYSRKKAASDGQ